MTCCVFILSKTSIHLANRAVDFIHLADIAVCSSVALQNTFIFRYEECCRRMPRQTNTDTPNCAFAGTDTKLDCDIDSRAFYGCHRFQVHHHGSTYACWCSSEGMHWTISWTSISEWCSLSISETVFWLFFSFFFDRWHPLEPRPVLCLCRHGYSPPSRSTRLFDWSDTKFVELKRCFPTCKAK